MPVRLGFEDRVIGNISEATLVEHHPCNLNVLQEFALDSLGTPARWDGRASGLRIWVGHVLAELITLFSRKCAFVSAFARGCDSLSRNGGFLKSLILEWHFQCAWLRESQLHQWLFETV